MIKSHNLINMATARQVIETISQEQAPEVALKYGLPDRSCSISTSHSHDSHGLSIRSWYISGPDALINVFFSSNVFGQKRTIKKHPAIDI